MCGLAGLFVTEPSRWGELSEIAAAMTAPIRHRGPDDFGVWAKDSAGIALGFRRLSIIDLSKFGHQPMQSASGRFVMVYNGEVFNHRSIRAELMARGALFQGHSDTEVM